MGGIFCKINDEGDIIYTTGAKICVGLKFEYGWTGKKYMAEIVKIYHKQLKNYKQIKVVIEFRTSAGIHRTELLPSQVLMRM